MSPASKPGERLQFRIRGMHCAGCAASVERALRRVPGVTEAAVNLATGQATVTLTNDAPDDPGPCLDAVRRAGYDAEPIAAGVVASGEHERRDDPARERRRLTLAVVLGLPLLGRHLAEAGPPGLVPVPVAAVLSLFAGWPAQATLTVAILIVAGGPMLLGAGRALVRRTANMDLLVSLGAVTALVASVFGVALHIHELMLFHAAAPIVLFVAVGKHLEARARGRASAALRALLARLPQTAQRVAGDAVETVALDDIRPGDVVRVPAHAAVPVDGDVLAGHGAVDESLLTGESLPRACGPGDRVLGGTRVLDGLLGVRATASGAESAAARIARLVADAQAAKPPWQRFADRVASVFVPAVVVLAVLTLLGWKLAGADTAAALTRMIAVLVVACPCALGLAIPTAVLVGTSRAAERGILVRDPAALEAAGRVRTVLLDKTGTLTLGRPSLQAVVPLGGRREEDVLRLVAAVEQHSEHPLARALVAAARERGLTWPAARELRSRPGAGVRADVAGADVVVGTAAWLAEQGVATSAHPAAAEEWAATGATVVWAGLDGQAAALFVLSDTLHPEAAAAVAALRALGVATHILSGDRAAAVRHVAQQLGVASFEAELSPADKLARVQALAGRDGGVAMVGDGVNDAPALAAADVGIAIGTGADVARETADICLVGHSPLRIADAIRLSRRSSRVMKQNLFWALAYNVVMLPLAMLAPLPPTLATVAMMLSSLTVVGNALRLRRAA